MSAVLYDVPGPRARRRGQIAGGVAVLVLLGIIAAVLWKLDSKHQLDAAYWTWLADPGVQRNLFVYAVLATLKVALISILLALVLGAVLAAGRLSEHRWSRVPATVVIEFFRAVPLLLLILFTFLAFGPKLAPLGEALHAEPAAPFGALVVGLTLYNGSVLAEVFRAGINAVASGQSEAAYALGMRKTQVMTLILMPQAVRIMLPAIVSQCVVALKDSALGFIIGYAEILRVGKGIYGDAPDNFGTPSSPIIQVAIVVAAIYIAINLLLSWLAGRLERRMRRSRRIAGTVLTAADVDGTGMGTGTGELAGAVAGLVTQDATPERRPD
ncbi:MAG: gluD [Pseudonocardia sp.]|nr:gluD [Pseudonocardia sp.]